MKPLFLLALLSLPAQARQFDFVKQVNADVLQSELVAVSFAVQGINCSGAPAYDRCSIFMPDSEAKDPSAVVAAHVYVDQAAKVTLRKSQLRTLALKLKNNNAAMTQTDRDNLMLLIVYFLQGVE